MSTVITRIMHKLRVGSDAGRVKTDDRGNSIWEWKDSDAGSGNTSVLLKRLDNDQLALAETRKLEALQESEQQPNQDAAKVDDAEPKAPADKSKRTQTVRSSGGANKFGKKIDGGGGFNPYG
jgi:hypothetical protein